MHAAIYDAVNAIERTHTPYVVDLSGVSRRASQEAAAAAAAHGVLVGLYPKSQAMLDTQLEESLAQVPDGPHKRMGIHVGQTVAERMLALRSNDGSNAQLLPFVPRTNPGDYQLTPPNFPSSVHALGRRHSLHPRPCRAISSWSSATVDQRHVHRCLR